MDLRTCKTLIVYGGSFDPPQCAHVALPQLAMAAIQADAVAYIPAGHAPHKPGFVQTPAHHRLAMLLRGARGRAPLRDSHRRTGSARPILHHRHAPRPAPCRLGPEVQFRLLIGADMLRIFHQWRDPAGIVALAEPLVMLRPPDNDRDALLAALPADFDRQAWATRFIDLPRMDISSTQLRARIAAGLPIMGMVPGKVEEYIGEKGLYRGKSERTH